MSNALIFSKRLGYGAVKKENRSTGDGCITQRFFLVGLKDVSQQERFVHDNHMVGRNGGDDQKNGNDKLKNNQATSDKSALRPKGQFAFKDGYRFER